MRDSNQTYFVYKYYIFVYNGIADEADRGNKCLIASGKTHYVIKENNDLEFFPKNLGPTVRQRGHQVSYLPPYNPPLKQGILDTANKTEGGTTP